MPCKYFDATRCDAIKMRCAVSSYYYIIIIINPNMCECEVFSSFNKFWNVYIDLHTFIANGVFWQGLLASFNVNQCNDCNVARYPCMASDFLDEIHKFRGRALSTSMPVFNGQQVAYCYCNKIYVHIHCCWH